MVICQRQFNRSCHLSYKSIVSYTCCHLYFYYCFRCFSISKQNISLSWLLAVSAVLPERGKLAIVHDV